MDELDLEKLEARLDSSGSSWLSPGLWLIISLIVIAVIGNYCGTWSVMSAGRSSPQYEGLQASIALGLLVGEACLIAIWLTLGTQTFLVRICLALGTLFALACLFNIGLFQLSNGHMPTEVAFIVFGIAFALVGVVSIPLGLVRWKGQRVISRASFKQDVEGSQFGIRHLLIATAITAVLIPLAQATFADTDFAGGAPWAIILSFIAIYMLLSLLVCLLSTALVFDKKRRALNLVLLASVIFVGALIANVVLASSFTAFQNNQDETIVNSIAYSLSLSLGLVVTLSVFLSAGYRLQKA